MHDNQHFVEKILNTKSYIKVETSALQTNN